MATLEDKILGEKLHNYCSSSESESENSDSEETKKTQPDVPNVPLVPNAWEGENMK